MLDPEGLEEVYRLRDHVSIKLVKVFDKQSGEVLGQVIRLLKARTKAIS